MSEWTHATDGESLFDLDYDGRSLSGAVRGPDRQVGIYLADTMTGAVQIIDTAARLALNRP